MEKELRIKKVFDIIEADPSKTKKEVLVEVGYSESYAESPQHFFNGALAKKEYAERFSDEELEIVHKEGLKATSKSPQLIDRDEKGRPIYEYIDEPDYSVRHKYLDSAYKLKASYSPEEHTHNILSPFIQSIRKDNNEKNRLKITAGE